MPISFQCGQCNKPYVVSDGLAGKKAMCKQCGNRMTIPGDAVTSSESSAVQARPAAPPRPAPPRPASGVPVSRPKPVPTNEPAFDDIYGLNEAPSALPVMPRIGGSGGDSESDDDAPVKKKKKKKGFFSSSGAKKASASSGGGISGRQLLSIAVVVIFGGLGAFRGLGLSSKSEVMKFNERQLAAVTALTQALKPVNDVPTAQAASANCNQIVNAMIADLETNGRKKARVSDINTAKQEIMPRLMVAKTAFESEVRRVAMIPGVIQALNIMSSMARLDALEKELVAQNANLGLQ
jgi:hypothetical protein